MMNYGAWEIDLDDIDFDDFPTKADGTPDYDGVMTALHAYPDPDDIDDDAANVLSACRKLDDDEIAEILSEMDALAEDEEEEHGECYGQYMTYQEAMRTLWERLRARLVVGLKAHDVIWHRANPA